MKVDKRAPYDFGVDVVGSWSEFGTPFGWAITGNRIADDLPRWLLDQPVLLLEDRPNFCVYLRGYYSDAMTRARREAIIRACGVQALMAAKVGTMEQGR